MEPNRKENPIIEMFKPVKEPERKNQVLVTLIIFLIIFLGLISYLVIYYGIHKQTFINNSYSRQENNLLKQNLRGKILDRNGQELAYSVLNEDRTQTRVYPYGRVFCHTVGYSSLGKSGIEFDENYYLLNSGDDLFERIKNKSEGGLSSGNDVHTTLDLKLSQIADAELGDRYGAVIVTEVSTGKILVMVSHPGFDPNDISSTWEGLLSDESNTALVNRAVQGLYPPGSTFKIFTAYEYEKEGFDTDSYSYTCDGSFINDGYKISCFHGTSHGTVNFTTSFAKSCNSSFANIGMSLDPNKFAGSLNSLLFNTDLPQINKNTIPAISTFDISDSYKQMQTSIGQGDTNVSPYHINLLTCAIAGNGTVMKPYMVESVTNSKGKTIKEYSDTEYKKIMDSERALNLSNLMKSVVEEGTASLLKNDNYTCAGKTGSAEYNNKGDSHAWFTGFAPCEDPQIAITVIVEKGGTGSSSAVPLAKSILDEYFKTN